MDWNSASWFACLNKAAGAMLEWFIKEKASVPAADFSLFYWFTWGCEVAWVVLEGLMAFWLFKIYRLLKHRYRNQPSPG